MNKKSNLLLLKSVSWLVIASFILATVLPVHYHLEHNSDTQQKISHSHVADSHSHVVDLHSFADSLNTPYIDVESYSFTLSPDGTSKNQSKTILALLLCFVLVVFPLLRLGIIRPHYYFFKIKQNLFINSALLRAPPLPQL